MNQDEEKQEKRGFKVQDRRRFSESGDARPGDSEAASDAVASGAAAGAATAAPPPPPAAEREAPQTAQREFELNFSTFVISLSTQALVHLGEIPNPIDNQPAVDLGAAKQMIDILGILKDKTHGNLDLSESGLLDNILYDLRLKYVERVRGRS